MEGPTRAELVAWAAGIFEGEGSIVEQGRVVRLQVKMTDYDVIARLWTIFGGRVYGPYKYDQGDGSERKPAWVWISDGSDPAAIAREMLPWLGERRRERAVAMGLLSQLTIDL